MKTPPPWGAVFDGNEGGVINAKDHHDQRFPFLSWPSMPMFGTAAEDATQGSYGLSQTNCNNLLREIVELKELHDEPLPFESQNSFLVPTLLSLPTLRIKTKDGFNTGVDKVKREQQSEIAEDVVVRSVVKYLCKKQEQDLPNRASMPSRTLPQGDGRD